MIHLASGVATPPNGTNARPGPDRQVTACAWQCLSYLLIAHAALFKNKAAAHRPSCALRQRHQMVSLTQGSICTITHASCFPLPPAVPDLTESQSARIPRAYTIGIGLTIRTWKVVPAAAGEQSHSSLYMICS